PLRVRTRCSPEWLIDRGTRLREEFRTIFSDVQTIFQANSELAVNHNCWFVAEAHARLNLCFVAPHKVRPLVPVKPDAVTGAMRQAWHFVIRAKARISNYFPRGGINRLARRADLCDGKGCILRFLFQVPNLTLPVGGLAEDKCARDV